MNKDIIANHLPETTASKPPQKLFLIITKSNWGGAQKYVFDLATNLPQNFYDITVILGGNGMLVRKLQENNIRVISLPSLQRDIKIKNELKSFWELFLILKAERPDIVHVNSSKAGGIGAFISRILGIKKIIFTAHAWAFNENRGFLSRVIISFFHWLTVVLTHHTIAVSESVKNQISHLPFMENKISVVHLGINSPKFLSKSEARLMLGISIPEGHIAIGTIAELHKVKGLNYAIDAINLIKEKDREIFEKIHYFIIGEGEEREALEKQIKKLGLMEKIHLMGFVQKASKHLKAFDYFLLPSLSEALGYVLLEAGLAEVPVLASNVGGIPEIIEHIKNGLLFSPADPKAITEDLLELIHKKDWAMRGSKNLLSKVHSEFDIVKMVKETGVIYNTRHSS